MVEAVLDRVRLLADLLFLLTLLHSRRLLQKAFFLLYLSLGLVFIK